jgi:peptidoglycan/LPS O-acetylase OafA/YrhL
MSNLRYRPEIDGLRALAVIGVVLYHIGLGFPGGYVGVDVFFVISGYLITGIITKDLRAGTFSMLDFWVRRIRRILPAVTVTVIASLILGYLILEAEQFKALAESSIAQSLMAANVFFWRDNMSYFAEASDMKPLLHTWSLAVEEQFYVVFPLLLSLLSKHLRKYTLPIIIFIGALSLALSCWALMHKPGANFFLLPTRAWELLAGAGIALMANQKEMSRRTAEVVAWLGLLMIAAAMLFYNAQTPFPGWAAIPPVAGSALFIWANGKRQTSAGQLLSFKPIVFIGLISYSFYLWHWPILVFAKHVIIDISLPWKLVILMISLILSILSWKWVETPFRRKGFLSKRSSAFGFAALSTIGLLLMSATIWKMNGLPDRYDDFVLLREDISWVGEEYKSELGSYVKIGAESSVNDRIKGQPSFALWGDSHALAISATVDQRARSHGLIGHVYAGDGRIPITECTVHDLPDHIDYSDEVIRSILDSGIKNVILVARWSTNLNVNGKTQLPIMAETLKKFGVQAWLIKQAPESNSLRTAQEFYMGKRFPLINDMPAQYTVSKEDHQNTQEHVNKAIDRLPKGLINVIDPAPYFFVESTKLKVYGDRAYYKDDDHLTRAGADYYLSEMFDGIFSKIKEQHTDSAKTD